MGDIEEKEVLLGGSEGEVSGVGAAEEAGVGRGRADSQRHSCGCFPPILENSARTSPPRFRHKFPWLHTDDPDRHPNRINAMSSSKTEFQPHIARMHTDKVPMMFSEKQTTIITDPAEVESMFRTENLRARMMMRTHSPDYRVTNLNVYITEPWFHSDMSREDANAMLKQYGYKDGSFLVRVSAHLPGCFILSVAKHNSVLHFPITQLKGEAGVNPYLSLDSGHTKFKDLSQLIEFYQVNTGGVLPIPLQNYVTKAISIPSFENRAAPQSSY